MKSTVKTRATTKTNNSDAQTFNAAFATAVAIHNSSTYNVRHAIEAMTPNDLQTLNDFLSNTNGKETNAVRMKRIHEFTPQYRSINTVAQQLLSATEHFKDLVHNDLEENWTTDRGKLMAGELKAFVTAVAYAEAKKNNDNNADATMKFVLDHTFSVIWMLCLDHPDARFLASRCSVPSIPMLGS